MKRRSFLRASTGLLSSLQALSYWAQADETQEYRALVCVFLGGGNDCWNFVGPCVNNSDGWTNLKAIRNNMGEYNGAPDSPFTVFPSDLSGTNPGVVKATAGDGDWALHSAFSPLTTISGVNTGIVGGVGTLAAKAASGESTPAAFPDRIGDHEQQTEQWQAAMGYPFDPAAPRSGTLGRLIAQLGSPNPMSCISLSQTNTIQSGRAVDGTLISGVYKTTGKDTRGILLSGVTGSGSGSSQWSPGLSLAEKLNNLEASDAKWDQGQLLNQRRRIARANEEQLKLASASFVPSGSIFSDQMQLTARMIQYFAGASGPKRQTFYVSLNQFDTHDKSNSALQATVAAGLKTFWDTLNSLNATLKDKVTLFTASEFGRTLKSNGAGTDHAWAGHQLVMGGGQVQNGYYGVFPVNRLGSDDDNADEKYIGRGTETWKAMWNQAPGLYRNLLLPHISVDEYLLPAANWFLGKSPLSETTGRATQVTLGPVNPENPENQDWKRSVFPNLTSLTKNNTTALYAPAYINPLTS